MGIKYWEYEDAPLKDKLKNVNVRDVAKIFFDNETEAYRFATLLHEVKAKKQMKLKDVPEHIPVATAKRYLDYAVELGLLKHEDSTYMLTDRFSKPLRNIATYIKEWMQADKQEDLAVEFAAARMEKQRKRGGKLPTLKEEGKGAEEAASG
jgi:hypothetical protein